MYDMSRTYTTQPGPLNRLHRMRMMMAPPHRSPACCASAQVSRSTSPRRESSIVGEISQVPTPFECLAKARIPMVCAILAASLGTYLEKGALHTLLELFLSDLLRLKDSRKIFRSISTPSARVSLGGLNEGNCCSA